MNPTELQIGDVLRRPLFQSARLAAGSRGLGRPVGWVHVIEIVQIAPFISRHDLILTTGLWLKQSQQDRLDYLRQLILQEAAGLILEIGTSIQEVPADLLELAEAHQFPVIVFDQPVRFSDITQDIHSLILNRRRIHQDLADSFSRRLQQLTLQHSDISSMLRLLHGETRRQTLYYSLLEPDRQHPPLSGGAGREQPRHSGDAERQLSKLSGGAEQQLSKLSGGAEIGQPPILGELDRKQPRLSDPSELGQPTHLAEPDRQELAKLPFRDLERDGRFGDGKSDCMLPLASGRILLLKPVLCYGQLLAAVGLVAEDDSDAAALSPYLESAASAAAALTLRTQFSREHESRRNDGLIPALLEGRVRSEDQARSMAGLPSRPAADANGAVLAAALELESMWPEDGSGGERLEGAARDLPVLLHTLIRKYGLRGSLHPRSEGSMLLLLHADSATAAARERLLSGAHSVLEDVQRFSGEQLEGLRLRAAAGKLRQKLLEAPEAFREAAQALEIARRVPELGPTVFYSQLGAYQLLQAIPDAALLDAFVQDHLGAILRLEKESRQQLLETLDMYLKCFGSKHETARRLFIHRQTLYNRMERLTELIGEPFLEPHKRIGLEMALMAYKLRSGVSIGRSDYR
ncbi:PucR family transcriptional regulator ligand-binding domain-containing protein [Paenibacillus pasadenensis]|uniref:PucR family transcriptional regulator n=1 Tax=Paenibacillus pasadenensis TaxID=217090 RepID=UPI002042677E|nr:PucR family transcriptional regulator [Paenibacillus pasadenensis]MCM3748508.1 PucR family transcriptional regulator ligand-binding domain-containing protein [Paenibacillus pasadenensis]